MNSDTDNRKEIKLERSLGSSNLAPLLVNRESKPAKGALILGVDPKTKKRIDLPQDLMLKHTAIYSISGEGKEIGFIYPQLAHFDGSIVHIEFDRDFVGTAWQFAAKHRQNTWLYNFGNSEISRSFNWIPLCKDNPTLCYQLAQAIILSTELPSSSCTLLTESAASLLSALFAHASSLEAATAITAFDLFDTLSPNKLISTLLESNNPMASNFIQPLASLNGKVQQAIFILVKQKLLFAENQEVRNILSGSLEPPDFSQLKKENIVVSWVMPELQAEILKPLNSLFVTLLLNQLKHSSGNTPVCLLLDEVSSMGRIPNLELHLTTLRSRNIGTVLTLSRNEQLIDVYGKERSDIILGNCSTKIFLSSFPYVLQGQLKETTKEPICSTTQKQIDETTQEQQFIVIDNNKPTRINRYWLDSQFRK